MVKKKVCFVMDNNPSFLGGTAVYVNYMVKYARENIKNVEVTCVYPGKQNKKFEVDKVTYYEVKTSLPFPLRFIQYGKKVVKILDSEKFDVINSHAMAGYYMKYFKNKFQAKLVHTYHGVAYYFYKIHLQGESIVKKLGSKVIMSLGKILEAPPAYKADKIICVSEHVGNEIHKVYGTDKRKIKVIRNGVDSTNFSMMKKEVARKKLNLDPTKKYFLYVGRGGYFRKGLDRAVILSQNLHSLDKRVVLIIIGPEKRKENLRVIEKVKDFSWYIPSADRKILPFYYNSADAFFCFSRYEGGAPILTLAEAMTSGCLPICSSDSNQEIIKNRVNGLVIQDFNSVEAKEILNTMGDSKLKSKIISNSIKTIKELTLEKWGNKYWKELLG